MADLIERTRMAAKILRDIGGQSAMAATVEEAAAALEAAREDAERLDWFDTNWFSAYRSCGPNGGLAKHCVLVEESQRSRSVADTMREAIDQARGKGGAGK